MDPVRTNLNSWTVKCIYKIKQVFNKSKANIMK